MMDKHVKNSKSRVFITGDTHGNFARFFFIGLTEDDLVIVLGDAGVNFSGKRDKQLKDLVRGFRCKFFFIRGNHDMRPEDVGSYILTEVDGVVKGKVFIEPDYPNLMFATEGIYEIAGRRCFVSNGAYSVDKHFRLRTGLPWFENEELSQEEMEKTIDLASKAGKVDAVLTHTCPYKYIPQDALLDCIDQKYVSNRMEKFYDIIENILDYDKWWCGHFHINRYGKKINFLYKDIVIFTDFMEENTEGSG